jgi:hypothetical protein
MFRLLPDFPPPFCRRLKLFFMPPRLLIFPATPLIFHARLPLRHADADAMLMIPLRCSFSFSRFATPQMFIFFISAAFHFPSLPSRLRHTAAIFRHYLIAFRHYHAFAADEDVITPAHRRRHAIFAADKYFRSSSFACFHFQPLFFIISRRHFFVAA